MLTYYVSILHAKIIEYHCQVRKRCAIKPYRRTPPPRISDTWSATRKFRYILPLRASLRQPNHSHFPQIFLAGIAVRRTFIG
jgi:hypothetical protein